MFRLSQLYKSLILLGGHWPARVAFYALMAVGLVIALTPNEYTPLGTVNDKIRHAFSFAVMSGMAMWSHQNSRGFHVFIAMTCYGLLIEGLQSLIPYRDGSLGDIVANTIGIAMGVFLANWLVVSARPPKVSH
ncbi:VanZ like family protein [Hahella chejuensis KCTC 2396]|uniref:VanZ like family protein n=1 Tax=Hahella chejuensis (strain KCTC 2396) TaxID=349521 RepID=Q2SNW1_HAHCH|nr:VanZ family protein [Hahella chejuensis]ABC27663.1 VanZ like family protein [Hahella chejuensis KCTC 2396]